MCVRLCVTFSDVLSQVILKPIVPQTQKEELEYSLAAERRRVRMLHDDIIKDLLSRGSIQTGMLDALVMKQMKQW